MKGVEEEEVEFPESLSVLILEVRCFISSGLL